MSERHEFKIETYFKLSILAHTTTKFIFDDKFYVCNFMCNRIYLYRNMLPFVLGWGWVQ